MSSCVCKISFKSVQVCGGCCKMFRGSLFLGHISHPYRSIMFITVTCCEGIAKKLFEHLLQSFTHDGPYIQVTAGRSSEVFLAPAACVIASASDSRTLHLDFQDFPGPGNFTNTIPGLIFPRLSETKLIFQVLEIFKNTIRGLKFPGLSKSWKFYRHNSRTFEVAWERCVR